MRLFIGLPLSKDAILDTARAAERCAQYIPGRYSLPENYHMTLAFLGEVRKEDLCKAEDALNAFAAQFPLPQLTLSDLSFFRQAHNAIFIRKAESPDDLAAMHSALINQLDMRSLPHTEGPFSPHVTLARHADVCGADLAALSPAPVSFTAHRAILYLSARDAHDILRYTPLASAPFVKSI